MQGKKGKDTMLNIALAVSARGRAVFPCRPDKGPYTSNGFKGATTDEAIIRTWWHQWPEALIGFPTGNGLLVIDTDLDPESGKDGEAQLAALPPLPPTKTIRTPRGGRHRYYEYDRALNIRCSADQVARGVDIRAEGGYVIISGKTSAGAYVIEDNNHPARLPQAWVDILTAPKKTALEKPQTSNPPAPPGAGLTPWDDFEQRTTWAAILTGAGWKQGHTAADGNTHWTRPGKTEGTSATTKGEDGPLFVFSGNAHPLPDGEGLSKFAVLSLYRHGGDMKAAAKALRAEGYGHDALDISGHRKEQEAAQPATIAAPAALPPYWTLSILKAHQPDPEQYLAGDGWMRRKAATLLVGATGIGKSVLAVQMAANLATGTNILDLIRIPQPFKTLIIQAENDIDTCKRDLCSIAEALKMDEELLDANLRIYHTPGLTPSMMGQALRQIHQDFPYAAIVLDNYQSFLGISDINATEGFFAFRAAVEPVLNELDAGLLLLAHPPKPKQDDGKSQRHAREGVYNAAGTSALPNWVRASCELAYVAQEEKRCVLRFAKNAERIGAKDHDGNPLRQIYLDRTNPDRPRWVRSGNQERPMNARDTAVKAAMDSLPVDCTAQDVANKLNGIYTADNVRQSPIWKARKGRYGT